MRHKRFLWYLFVLLACFGLIVTLTNPVFARQSKQADMPLEKTVVPGVKTNSASSSASSSAGGGATQSCRNVGGESKQIKVFPSFGATVIYLQCGHVVGKVMSTGCGCSAGNWRYTTNCQKSAPIYVNLPCSHHKP